MKVIFLTYTLLILSVFSLEAQDIDSIFHQANEAYRTADYKKALQAYQKIDSLGFRSADLFFNLGNTYYKLNNIAPSIYYYEKALLENPNHTDAAQNLAFARRMTIDAFEVIPKTLFQKVNERILYPISYNIWAWISVVLLMISSLFFLIYYYKSFSEQKRLFFVLSLIGLMLSILTLSITYKVKNHSTKDQPAIVFSDKIEVVAEPNLSAGINFELHEGTKVQILDSMPNWYEIKIADGKTGWIPQKEVKKLK